MKKQRYHNNIQVPTEADIQALWKKPVPLQRVSEHWCCPVCDRSKRELTRITEKKKWWADVNMHHDHGAPRGKGRFPDTLICGDCNCIDAYVKNKFPGLKGEWSFSPEEMRRVIIVKPHARHIIDYTRAYDMAFKLFHAYLESKSGQSCFELNETQTD